MSLLLRTNKIETRFVVVKHTCISLPVPRVVRFLLLISVKVENPYAQSQWRTQDIRNGGAENLRIMKTKRKISPLRISPFFRSKLGEDQKKGLRSDLMWFSAQNQVKTKKEKNVFSQILSVFVLKPSAQVTKGGSMQQFYMLFYAKYIILAAQRGGMAPWPLLKCASAQSHEDATGPVKV